MRIETERLILRAWTQDDAEALYKYASDPRVGPACGWPPHTSVENSREIIRIALSGPETYALELKATGEPVGCASIMSAGSGTAPMREGDASREIGYWLGVPHWGKGLVPEAVNALLDRCFEQLGCEVVWCGYHEGNDKSRRVQEKCGFIYHHTEKDKPCSQIDERRTEHFTRMTREQWARLRGKNAAQGGEGHV